MKNYKNKLISYLLSFFILFSVLPFDIVKAAEIRVATPIFSVASGTYTSTQTVAIYCTTGGATIRYTTNGTTPTASSKVYTAPIAVLSNQTIKAYAVKSGITDSEVVGSTYVIQKKLTAPTNLVSSAITDTSCTLAWTASVSVGVTGYDIYSGATLVGSTTGELNYNITGLKLNTKYNFTVKAKDAAGKVSAASIALSVKTLGDAEAPTAPDGLAASAISSTGFTLAWTASTDNVKVIGYDIYNGSTKVGSTTTALTYNIKGLMLDTTYNITVKAKDVAKNVSEASANLSVKTLGDIQAPTSPTGFAASLVTNTTLTLKWMPAKDNVGVTGYDIYSGTQLIGSTTGETSYNVTGLTLGTAYSFTVKAKDAVGNVSVASRILSTKTLGDTEPPTSPTGLEASDISSTGFILKWAASTDNVGVTGYDIYNGTRKVGSTTTELTYNVTGLKLNTTYGFTVKARDAAGKVSAVSTALSIKTLGDEQAPVASAGLLASAITCTTLTLTWKASTDNVKVTGYDIYNGATKVGSTTTALNYKITGLTANTNYMFTVIAKDAAGNNSDASIPLSVTTSVDNQAPKAPTGLVVSAITSTTFTLNWKVATDNVGVTGYDIYNGTTFVGSTTTTLSYNVTGLTPKTKYSFTVKAKDAVSNVSLASTKLLVTTIADTKVPIIPTGLVASEIKNTSLVLSWTAPTDKSGVAGYDIYNGVTKVGSTTELTYNISGLTANTVYNFTVKTKDAAGNVLAVSDALIVNTDLAIDSQVPTAPTGLVATSITDTTYTLAWVASSDAVGVTGYNIYNGDELVGSTTTTLTYNVSGLMADTTYGFTVKAKDAAGNISIASSVLSVTTILTVDTEAPTALFLAS